MNTTSLNDILAAQTAAENAYYQAGSPRSGPIFDAYTAALNATDRLQTQIENENYNTPGVQYLPTPPIVDPETGRITGAVPQPGGLTAVPLSSVDREPVPVNPTVDPEAPQLTSAEQVSIQQEAGNTDGYGSQNELEVPAADINRSATAVAPTGVAYDDDGNLLPGYTLDEDNNPVFVGGSFVEPATAASAAASRKAAATERARQQQTLKEQRKQSNNGDWRLKISLAPQANYLYRLPVGQAGGAGILWPLKETDGVIFPYTPSVQMNYKANYNPTDLTHSNYRGYFYQNSYVDAITINATFTAQSTFEAEYLLAVIHFFRSVTKMFYGQDTERGSPPPLVYLTGLGEYQFNRHACVVQNFAYTLPPDVDYIRARSVGQAGLNLTTRRDRQSQAPVNTGFSVLNRLQTAFLSKGAENRKPSPASLGIDSASYVPTKLDIQLSLLPMQSRSEISQQFSLKGFANGDLLKGGFW